jgi:glycine betaine catabolism A
MSSNDRVRKLLSERKAGHTLPQAFYRDRDIFEIDLDAIFYRNWLMIGFEVEIPNSGDVMAETIGRSPILIVRQKDGSIKGFHNSCRHRGAQICPDGYGHAARLTCPYHQWSYRLDGTLLSAGRMGDGFDKSGHGLKQLAVECVGGCIYVCLSDDVPDFAPFRADLEPFLAPLNLANGKLACSSVLVEQANWKLVMENGRECHHCAACHPELIAAFPISNADAGDQETSTELAGFAARIREQGLQVGPASGPWWDIGRYPFNPGTSSFSVDGKPLVKKALMEGPGEDIGTVRWAIEPHNFCHAAADSVFMFSAFPSGPIETRVVAKWLVHRDAEEGVDYDVERLTHLWTQTNLQDRDLAENNQRGVDSVGYRPGPYSPEAETYVAGFADWYCDTVEQRLKALPG